MSSDLKRIQIGLSENNPCNYLPNQVERVAVALDEELQSTAGYELLLANGFRRSGDTIYKPYCDHCSACQAIRVQCSQFKASKSQKRLLNKATHLRWEIKSSMDENWFELYRRYIEKRHANGSMYPANKDSFLKFSISDDISTQYLHIYDSDTLVAIAVTDMLELSCSSFYTFYEPDFPLSLGTLAVLYQIEYCTIVSREWLYLGYQIDECAAMNYKVRFDKHQRLVNHRWQG
jgi:arginine-tRNA-protein transferase